MSNKIWDKFDKKIDTKGLKADAEEVAENGLGDFKEVEPGKYEVAIDKIELKETKKGDPMLSIWFKILDGEGKGSIIFYNQVLTTGYGIHNANEFLRSLETEVEVKFDNFNQFGNMIMDIFEEVNGNLEFILNYGVNKKGFNTYKIEEVFEA